MNLKAMFQKRSNHELRPLPLGMAEFDAWADRIVKAAALPADSESQKFALAEMIMHLNPREDFKDDAFFIHSLRKAAANQIAHAKMTEIRDRAKLRLAKDESAQKPS